MEKNSAAFIQAKYYSILIDHSKPHATRVHHLGYVHASAGLRVGFPNVLI